MVRFDLIRFLIATKRQLLQKSVANFRSGFHRQFQLISFIF